MNEQHTENQSTPTNLTPANSVSTNSVSTNAPSNSNQQNSPAEKQYGVIAGVIVAALIIAGAIVYGPAAPGAANNDADVVVNAPVVDIAGISTTSSPFIGKANAPLTIMYWSDYQCPFCRKFDVETVPQIVKNYVDTGKVKLVFKDFQFLGQDSFTLALTARAIWELYPDKYYQWRVVFFENQGEENSGYATKEYIQSLADKVPGIDMNKVNEAILKNKAAYQASILADKTEGGKVGINGTPGTIVGNRLFSGAVSYKQVAKVAKDFVK